MFQRKPHDGPRKDLCTSRSIMGVDNVDWIPPEEIELARARLARSPHISEFLGKWLEPAFAKPVLGDNVLLDLLSDPPIYPEDDPTENKIGELEQSLKDGKANCHNFAEIFKGNLAANANIANSQVLDRLVEVEGYRWLRAQGFHDVRKPRAGDRKTVDFVGAFAGTGYGIEITRLGVAESERKRVNPTWEAGNMAFYEGKEALPKIALSVWQAVKNKLPQLREHRRAYQQHRLLVIISTGRRFLLSRKVVRRDAGALPATWRRSLEPAWDQLDEPERNLLDAVVLLDGQNQCVHPKTFLSSSKLV